MNDKLFKIASYAYEKVQLYNNFGYSKLTPESDFDTLPLIHKDDFLSDFESAISSEHIMDYYNGKLMYASTSGSTGTCLDILFTPTDYNNSMLSLWIARKKRYNIQPADRFCYFYTSPSSNEEDNDGIRYQFLPNQESLGFNKSAMSLPKLARIYDMISEYKPVWLMLQPSIAILLAECIKEKKLPHIDSLKLIELTGEMLFDDVRDEIINVFGCPVANQYGCNEVNSIAYECECGNLHCMSSNVYVEVLDENDCPVNNKEGDIYITSYHNTAMPFVRYGIGDRGCLDTSTSCSCGNLNPIIRLTSGRSNDFIRHSVGTKTDAAIFVHPIEAINTEFHAIKQFQVIQEDYEEFTINIVLHDSCKDMDEADREILEDTFLDNLDEPTLYEAEFTFNYCDALYPDKVSNKLKYFTSKCL